MDLSEKTTEELIQLRDKVEGQISAIRTQLDFAKSDAAANKNYSDIDWFNNAKHSLRRKGRLHQRVIREISSRKKKAQSEKNNTVQKHFIRIAKEHLDKGTFSEIWSEAVEASSQ